LLPTILLLCGKVNFTNLSRYSGLSEKSFRRHYSQTFNFTQLNAHLMALSPSKVEVRIAAMDHSFIPKSGQQTYGLDWFYNGTASRSQKGLEISTIAVIGIDTHQTYTLSARQTPPDQVTSLPTQRRQTVAQSAIDQAQTQLQQLPVVPANPRISLKMIEQAQQQLQQLPECQPTRTDHTIAHLQASAPYLPKAVSYLVVDAAFSHQKFVDAVRALSLHVVGKLRHDANLKYLYTGEQKPRGAKRKYDGKVHFQDLSRLSWVKALEPNLNLYTAGVWHVTLKRQIRIAYVVDTRKAGKRRCALFFSSDLSLGAEQILAYYRARFQIEFIYREAKQFTGLCDAQTRDPQRLDFHFNASLTALNLARYEAYSEHSHLDKTAQPMPFSMSSYKRLAFNDHLLSRFIAMLDLDSTLIKSHPNYEKLRSYGVVDS
jgi:hypothetical protein